MFQSIFFVSFLLCHRLPYNIEKQNEEEGEKGSKKKKKGERNSHFLFINMLSSFSLKPSSGHRKTF